MSPFAQYDLENPQPQPFEGETEYAFNKRWAAWVGARTDVLAKCPDFFEQCKTRLQTLAEQTKARKAQSTGVIYDEERMHQAHWKTSRSRQWLHTQDLNHKNRLGE